MEKEKLNFFEIVWVFTIGSFLGYIGECTFYVLKYHYFVNKQGMIMGPLKPMYGLALLFATIVYKKLKANKKWQQFIYGMILGGFFEYLVSFLLEKIWHIYFWDYSSFKFNINGRVYLPYCVMWGIIGMIYYSYLLPFIIKIYNKLKGRIFNIISIILTIFICINSILTWTIFFRIRDYSKTNNVYKIVDYLFPKETVKSRLSKARIKE